VVGPGNHTSTVMLLVLLVVVLLNYGFSSDHFFYCVFNHNTSRGRRSAILQPALEGVRHMLEAVENSALVYPSRRNCSRIGMGFASTCGSFFTLVGSPSFAALTCPATG